MYATTRWRYSLIDEFKFGALNALHDNSSLSKSLSKMCDYRTPISCPLYNKKGSDYDITASVDLQDVAQVQQFNASNNVATSNPASSSGVKRSVSGTWNKPARTNSQAEAEQLLSSPKRTISTQTLEGKVS